MMLISAHPPQIFWLHIKKAGGTSLRELFADFYVLQEARYTYPKPFVAIPKAQWNDALNNYRMPLGEYDYRRMLFAKKFLYTPDEFSQMFKFVVVRNPYDRIVSAWKYLFRYRFYDYQYLRMKYSFQYFLDELPRYMDQRYRQIYHLAYIGLHVAPIWPDITDENGQLLVDHIVRIENFNEDIQVLNDRFGLNIQLTVHKNASKRIRDYQSYYRAASRKRVEAIFASDLENLGYTFEGGAPTRG